MSKKAIDKEYLLNQWQNFESNILDPKYLDEMDIEKDSALIYTSFAGYCAEQDTKSISKYCSANDILSIEIR